MPLLSPKEQAAALHVQLVDGAYEICGHEPMIGPYERKAEAEEDLNGVRKFYLSLPEPTQAEILADILGD